MTTKHKTAHRTAEATPSLRERAERLRDAAGRFIRRPAPNQERPPAGTVPAPLDAHPDAYGLMLDANGAGLRCPPGSSVVVEPVSPTGAGLAIFYRKGGGPEIWDLTHNFAPGMLDVGDGAEMTPLVEVVEPNSGRRGQINAGSVEKVHRVVGVYMPVEVMDEHRSLPSDLPLMTECPEGMVLHYADCAAAYPLVRHGETVVVDPSRRDLVDGALCLLEWNNGSRSILQTNHRAVGKGNSPSWWADPINRPGSRQAMERLLRDRAMLFMSDGPYSPHRLREKIVGTVVGVLVPGDRQQASLSVQTTEGSEAEAAR
ncbi:hypothetical protein MKK58_09405 [Methylobacterium sp. J-078]|uniref:hypothetical protein n=1 Tax=Methylobacterium sp. J-078 TaxID=2836657 RepID=UPI001FBBDD18|nr:hypothetical protein [Methylobacterium sp. J-078]MCJ2044742.1 hypothetical protein [Methylobacterium sp. J-078]